MIGGKTGDPASGTPQEIRYANQFRVGFTEFEFIIEAAHRSDGEVPPHTRITVLPVYASQLQLLLFEALEEYRRQFGVLPVLD